jgi:Spy/CpxP family protein refolding chaperone
VTLNTVNTSQQDPSQGQHRRGTSRRIIGGIAGFGIVLGLMATTAAFARPGGLRGFMGHGRMDPTEIKFLVNYRVGKALNDVGASEAQKAQVKAIMDREMEHVGSHREEREAMHARAKTLLTSPNVDAASVEAFRQEMLAKMDDKSKHIANVVTELANVLTPQQRAALMERCEAEHHGGPF